MRHRSTNGLPPGSRPGAPIKDLHRADRLICLRGLVGHRQCRDAPQPGAGDRLRLGGPSEPPPWNPHFRPAGKVHCHQVSGDDDRLWRIGLPCVRGCLGQGIATGRALGNGARHEGLSTHGEGLAADQDPGGRDAEIGGWLCQDHEASLPVTRQREAVSSSHGKVPSTRERHRPRIGR